MTFARRLFAVAALGLATSMAHAGNISWSIGINLPPVGAVVSDAPYYGGGQYYEPPQVAYRPAPVYYSPPAVIYRPAPVYYSPAPAVVYRQVPRYVGPPVYVVERRWPGYRGWDRHGHQGHFGGHGGRRDRDWNHHGR